MFTGIIQEIGIIKKISSNADTTSYLIEAPKLANDQKIGDSISVDGICSTITKSTKTDFSVQFMLETLKKTSAQSWKEGMKVNIEPALKLSDKLNGHIVSGHIDSPGTILKIKEGKDTKEIDISFPKELSKYISLKGSIAIDGVSLTISYLDSVYFTVSLIPHTLKNTTLSQKKEKDTVNLEVDLISRYLKQLFDERDKESSYEFLKERGFI